MGERGLGKEHTLSCKCLNVKISITSELMVPRDEVFKNESWDSIIFSDPKLYSAPSSHCDDISSAEQPALVCNSSINGWCYQKCANCELITHAFSKSQQHFFVNETEMLNEAQQLEVTQSGDLNFSSLYKFVPYKSSTTSNNRKSVMLRGSAADSLDAVHEKADTFISREKQRMQRRIKEFEEAELTAFEKLKKQTICHQNLIEEKIRLNFSDMNEDNDSAYEKSTEEIDTLSERPGRTSSNPDGDLFEMDPFIEEPADGDQVFSDDDDSTTTPNYLSRPEEGSMNMKDLAKSMPVAVPGFRGHSKSIAHYEDLSGDETTPNFENMQASMRALAQSVGGDGTEMFGDLPRSRFQKGGY